jgi:hypothetical protein
MNVNTPNHPSYLLWLAGLSVDERNAGQAQLTRSGAGEPLHIRLCGFEKFEPGKFREMAGINLGPEDIQEACEWLRECGEEAQELITKLYSRCAHE